MTMFSFGFETLKNPVRLVNVVVSKCNLIKLLEALSFTRLPNKEGSLDFARAMGGVRTPELPSQSAPSLTGLLSEAFVSVFEYLSLPCPVPSSSSSSWPATLQTAAHWYFRMNPVTVKRRLPQIEVPRQQKRFLSEDTPLGSFSLWIVSETKETLVFGHQHIFLTAQI